MSSLVYFQPLSKDSSISDVAASLLRQFVSDQKISLVKDLPIKIHPGAIGNTAYTKPENYVGMIDYLKENNISPFYIETCMEASDSTGKEKEFVEHGFKSQLPVIIADGPQGRDQVKIPIVNGRHLQYSLIAKRLADSSQVLVVSHFKGHCMSGFGGALKMLGIGFASGQGKTLVHSIADHLEPGYTIDWEKSHLPGISAKWVKNWDSHYASSGQVFTERLAESAQAAALNKKHLYITFAINIVNNCDCDGMAMDPVYPDLGIFVSSDPVAIDKAAFDKLKEVVGETPFEGEQIFAYAEKLGLGSTSYSLVTLPN